MRRRFSSGKAVLAALLSVCVLSTTLPTTALADQTTKNQTTTDQTTDDEPVCSKDHEYKEELFEEVQDCQHTHTDECYPEGGGIATSGNADIASYGNADIASFGNARYPRSTPFNGKEPSECTHKCSKENGCIIKKPVCPICSIQERINELPTVKEVNGWQGIDKEKKKGKLKAEVQSISVSIEKLDEGEAGQLGTDKLDQLVEIFQPLVEFTEKDYVKGLTPSNVTVNLFDYWLRTRSHEDYAFGKNVQMPQDIPMKNYYVGKNSGINTGHAFVFVGPKKFGLQNNWTGKNNGAYKNLVKRNLVTSDSDGKSYPYVQLAQNDVGAAFQLLKEDKLVEKIPPMDESLAYLFSPEIAHAGKQSFTSVEGLFQIDEVGNYYYDSGENFAEFIENEAGNGGSFRLYNAPGVTGKDHSSMDGQFFPFNTGAEVFVERKDDGKLEGMKQHCEHGMNHYFGLSMEVDFMQPVGGKISNSTATEKNDMVFEFEGDDDIWVFIDDVLVADLGGIHDTMRVNINFSDGTVQYSQYTGDPVNFTAKGSTTLRDQFKAAYREAYGIAEGTPDGEIPKDTMDQINADLETVFGKDGKIFRDDTTHTMKVFYLERGNYSSNLALEFNLLEPHYHQIEKVDEDGNPLPGVVFDLYEADKNWKLGKKLVEGLKSGDDGKVNIVDRSGGKAEGNNVTFKDEGHYILREKETLPGYVNTGDIYLSYSAQTNILTVENQWTVGAVGGFEADVVQAGPLGVASDANATDPEEDLVERAKKGLIVPVTFFKKEGQWYPMYGSVINGFRLIEHGDAEGAAMAALLYHIYDKSNEKWYLDWNEDHARFEGHLKGLPGFPNRYIYVVGEDIGDIKTEYYLLEHSNYTEEMSEEAKYNAIKTTLDDYVDRNGGNLDQAIEEMVDNLLGSAENAPKLLRLDVSDFIRRFYSHLYVPNQARELRVMKQDEQGNPLAGAEFTLYDNKECTNAVARGITDVNGLLTFSVKNKGNNAVNGGELSSEVEFALAMEKPANEEPKPRSYWLKETQAPEGYKPNDFAIEVRITKDGLYVNATGRAGNGNGTVLTNDLVSVRIGIGELVQTMVRYASSDDLNITLRDVKAIPYVLDGVNNDGDALSGSTADKWKAFPDFALQLHYGWEGALRDYGEHALPGQESLPYFIVEDGWGGFQVKQHHNPNDETEKCPDPEANKATGEWVDLEKYKWGNDLTNLFTGTNTVVVKNVPEPEEHKGHLKVSKVATGVNANPEDEFGFRVILSGQYTDINGVPHTAADVTGTFGDMRFTYGISDFKLKSGESCWAMNLPAGLTYQVVETDAKGYTLHIPDNAFGTILDDSDVEVPFVNEKGGTESRTGSLTVEKTVTGSAGDKTREFHFKVELGDTSINGDFGAMNFTNGVAEFILKDGESRTAEGLPVGAYYKVTEEEANRDGYITTSQHAEGNIPDKGITASFENKKGDDPDPEGKTGNLQVRKFVSGADETELQNDVFGFRVTLSKKDANGQAVIAEEVDGLYGESEDLGIRFEKGEAEITLKHGESRLATGLPAGLTYHIVETEKGEYEIERFENASGTIEEGKTAVATCYNKKSEDPSEPGGEKGSLTVRKTVTGSAGEKDRAFNFKVELASAVSGVYGQMTFENGVAEFALKDGESRIATDLPLGLGYTVTEKEANADGYITTAVDADGTIRKEGNIVSFTNNKGGDTPPPDPEKKYGALTVSKTVSGSRGDRYKSFAFTVTLHDASINGAYGDMEFENGIARFTLKHGETKTATNLPDGTEYVVEESDNTGYKVTWTGKTGKIEADKTAAVLCQNYRGGGGGGDDDDDDPPEDPYVPYIPPVPGDPGRPGIPPVPGDPGVPFVPERPMVPGLPRTGDDTSYGLWFGLLAVSGLGLLTLYFKGRKKKDEEEE